MPYIYPETSSHSQQRERERSKGELFHSHTGACPHTQTLKLPQHYCELYSPPSLHFLLNFSFSFRPRTEHWVSHTSQLIACYHYKFIPSPLLNCSWTFISFSPSIFLPQPVSNSIIVFDDILEFVCILIRCPKFPCSVCICTLYTYICLHIRIYIHIWVYIYTHIYVYT